MGGINLDTDFYESEDPIWNPALLTIPVPGIRRMVNLAADLDDVIHFPLASRTSNHRAMWYRPALMR